MDIYVEGRTQWHRPGSRGHATPRAHALLLQEVLREGTGEQRRAECGARVVPSKQQVHDSAIIARFDPEHPDACKHCARIVNDHLRRQ